MNKRRHERQKARATEEERYRSESPGRPGEGGGSTGESGSSEHAGPGRGGYGFSETGRELTHHAREKAEEVTHETRHQLSRAAEERKDRAADKMERVARALRRTADSLEEEDAEEFGDYPDRAADRLDRISRYLRQSDVGTLMADTEDFARRRPELFFGGLTLAGLAAGRFLRSSSPSGRSGRGAHEGGGKHSQSRETEHESGIHGLSGGSRDLYETGETGTRGSRGFGHDDRPGSPDPRTGNPMLRQDESRGGRYE
jgi:hypothetical protein